MAETARRRGLQVLGAALVSGTLLTALALQVDLEGAQARLSAMDPRWVAAAAGLAGVVLLLRALRFRAVTERARLGHVVAAIAGQTALNRVAPFKLGELSLPYLLHRAAAEPPARSLVLLAVVRLLELWVLCVALALAAGLWFGEKEWPQLAVAAGAGLGFTVLLLTFRRWSDGALRLADALAGRIGLDRWGRVATLWETARDRLRAAIRSTAALSGGQRGALLASTVLVQVAQYSLKWCLIASVAVEVDVLQLVVGYTLAQVAGALPVLSVGNVGTHEAGWVAGFVWVGMPLADAVLTGILVQVITLVFAGLFAVPAAIWFATRPAARAPEAPDPRPPAS